MGTTLLRRGLLTVCTAFAGFTANAQYEMDQVLRIGYRLGIESFKPAYTIYNYNSSDNTYTMVNEFKDRMGLSNYEIWYCRYSPHVFYEANLDGMVNALMNYVLDSRYEYEKQFSKFRNSKANTGFQVNAIDYDIFNMRMAFGTRGIFLGGQLKWTRLGSYTDDDGNSTATFANSFGHSETDIASYGLGLHANITVSEFVTQTHLMYNWIKSGDKNGNDAFFFGNEIEFESIISFGQGFGGYITPFFRKRMGHGVDKTSTTDLYSNGFTGSTAFGIKLGIYLAQEDDRGGVYINVLD